MPFLSRKFWRYCAAAAGSGRARIHSASSSPNLASSAYVRAQAPSPATHETPSDLTRPQREGLEAALRVDQAGEVAANYIYMGQMAVLGSDPKVGGLIQNMWDQEKRHLSVMNALQAQHRVKPTILHPLAQVGGWSLGAVTALMGREAAMACTEAVETVIGEHYDDQLAELDGLKTKHPSIPLLKSVIEEFRDDELEHLDTAVEHHSQRAPAHALLTAVVEAGCKVAIELCKKV
ncbi:unnamed protein product [Rhizoctonia solani]|uniref:5-demethoxyubiquinone hydroxylase, mitochondrial n=1 Tax=Rhizoctonia solani TaxID=456999 RepID=A0A8H7ILX6_9AGAM|nr:5-demethoxyubiquinone hydroxylase, mitochondrial [Rhizoctonia solani]CAE6475498.1 unnamed protein product [Rhizoctonia solani]